MKEHRTRERRELFTCGFHGITKSSAECDTVAATFQGGTHFLPDPLVQRFNAYVTYTATRTVDGADERAAIGVRYVLGLKGLKYNQVKRGVLL